LFIYAYALVVQSGRSDCAIVWTRPSGNENLLRKLEYNKFPADVLTVVPGPKSSHCLIQLPVEGVEASHANASSCRAPLAANFVVAEKSLPPAGG
jgi:hypothetical protein